MKNVTPAEIARMANEDTRRKRMAAFLRNELAQAGILGNRKEAKRINRLIRETR